MRLYDDKECGAVTKYGRVHRWRLERQGKFPKRVRLGKRKVVWLADEIDAWIEERVAERDAVTR